MAVKCARIELFRFCDVNGEIDREAREKWKQLAIDCQRMKNRLWQIWLVHHSVNNSAQQLRDHLDAFAEWKKAKDGPKPKWPCNAVEPPLSKSADSRSFYRILSSEFPHVNVRTRGLLTNAWQSRLNKRKAASGSLPGWVSILFANESLPSYTRPQPIPFDKDNARLSKADGKYLIDLRLVRDIETGKSHVQRCELMLRKRKSGSFRAIMDRILAGEYQWKGSSLVFDRGKWYASISYEMPARTPENLHAERTLYVLPGKRAPWLLLSVDERGKRDAWMYAGRGVVIGHARRAVLDERASRKEHYRFAGSNAKGKGRKRATATWAKLSSRWMDFVKRFNNETTRRIVDIASDRGVGRIVYWQPIGLQRDRSMLSRIGNRPGSAMLWDWFQVGTMLAAKCQEMGIAFETTKTGEAGHDVVVQAMRGQVAAKPAGRRRRSAARVR